MTIKAVTGTFAATGQSASLKPVRNEGTSEKFNVDLSGASFVGVTIAVQRSFDNGVTWVDLTGYSYTAPASVIIEEPEEGVLYRLNCSAYTSGTVNYRLSH